MLVFLVPAALFGLALLSVPVLLHLFRPRKVRVVPFSSLRWLRSSRHRLSHHLHWHQLVLFLLRAALIVLLVLALGRPVVAARRAAGKTERFIILDVSRSMRYLNPDGARTFAAARDIAEDLLLRRTGRERSAVLLAGGGAEPLGALAENPAGQVARLRTVAAGAGEGDLTGALQFIPSLLAPRREGARVELFFITDNLAGSWRQGAIARFLREVAAPVRAQVFKVGPEHPRNAWIAAAELLPDEPSLPRRIRVRAAAVGDAAQSRTLRLSQVAGLPELTRNIALPPGVPVQLEFELPAGLNLRGQVARFDLEPPDALDSDDRYWLNLDARGWTRVLVIEPELGPVPDLQPGFHLRTALEALAAAQPGALQIVRRSDDAVHPGDLVQADVIMLADVPALADDCLAQLEEQVKRGAGLVFFLGPSIRDDFYNTRFFNPARPAASLLPVRIGALVGLQKRSGELAGLGELQWAHPLLAALDDPTFSDLPQVRFRSCYLLEQVAGRSDVRILATLQGRAPALVESRSGAGRVLLFNTTAGDAWSDLPRRKCFVPLVDRMLQYLAGGAWRGTFEVGDAPSLPLRDALTNGTVIVTTPGGRSLRPAVRSAAGRLVMQLPAVREAGVYRVAYPAGSRTEELLFVVQTGRRDSALLPANPDLLRRWWQPAEFEELAPDLAAGRRPLEENGLALDLLLMALALGVFLAELWLTYGYCPAAPPRGRPASAAAPDGFLGGRQA